MQTNSCPQPADAIGSRLALLQHGDSSFPSGSVSFSHGIEALHADGLLGDAAAVERALRWLLAGRFAGCERALLVAAWHAGADMATLCELDALGDAAAPAREMREGARMAGRALLSVHTRLQTPGAALFSDCIASGLAGGHLPVVQGLVWRGVGLSAADAVAMAAHGLCQSVLGAALRLGVIGHLSVQAIGTGLRPWLAALLQTPVPAPACMYASAPLLDIAAMRHETQSRRLFAS